MAAGETTVGGIVGFLRLDDDQFNRAVDAAIARIRLLDGQDADVDVRVDTHGGDRDLNDVDEAMRRVTRSNDRMGQSFRRSRGLYDPKVIATLVVAGLAVVGPVAAAATAALAGFTGAVGVGALAWRGFKDEIKSGTDLGINLKSQLDDIKASVVDLSDTSANAMGPGLLAGLKQIDDFLPTLDGSVSAIARNLGDAFNIGVGGLLNGLQVAMPLLEDGGVYARQMAQAFADFTASQDFKDFIAYARQELPQVIDDLGKLTKGLIDMAAALAPVGEGVLHAFGAIGEGMSKMSDATGKSVDVLKTVFKFLSDHAGPDGPWNQQKVAVDNTTTSLQAVDAAITAASGAAAAAAIDVNGMSTAYGVTVAALDAATAAQQKQAGAAQAATLQMQLQNDAAGILKQSLDLLNGESLSAAEAQNAFDSSLVNMGDHVDKTGKKVKFTTTSITNMSSASVALRGQLNGQIANLQRVVEANGGLADSTGKARAQMKTMRQQIIDNAVAHGVDRKAVTAYVDSVLKIPKKVPPTKLDIDKKVAEEKLAAIKAHLLEVARNYTATVTVQTIGSGRYAGKKVPGGAAAAGGTVGGHGAPTADDQLYWLSTGEEVINAAAAKKWRPLLKAINASGLAAGGTAGHAVDGLASGGTAKKKTDPMVALRAQYGRWLDTDAVGALIGMPDAVLSDAVQRINTAFDKVAKLTDGLAKSHKRSARELARDATDAEKALTRIANQRDKTVDRLATATDTLEKVQSQYDDLLSQVTSQAGARGALDQLFFGQDADGNQVVRTWQDALASMQQVVTDTKSFSSQIDQLRAAGLNESLIQQIIGDDQGSAMAQAILAGGQQAITEFNNTASALAQASSALGRQAADGLYGSALAAAKSQVAFFKDQQAKLEAQMLAVGKALRDALDAGLAGKSTGRTSSAVNAAIKAANAKTVQISRSVVPTQPTGQDVRVTIGMPQQVAFVDVDGKVQGYMQVQAQGVVERTLAGLRSEVGMRA